MSSDYPYMEGSTFDKYARKLEEGITEASQQSEERTRDPETGQFTTSTPETDWEKRYKDLETHNSRQAQELGTLRNEVGKYQTAFDQYLLGDNPTPTQEQTPFRVTSDDLFEKPDEVINQAVENHPAIRAMKEAEERRKQEELMTAQAQFQQKHPNYQETVQDPTFAEWVRTNPARVQLAQQADGYDFNSADVLFSLWEQEQQLNGLTTQNRSEQAFQQAQLEEAGVGEPPPQSQYSRREMREYMIAAKQGDVKAERYLEAHMPKYRAALANGSVTD